MRRVSGKQLNFVMRMLMSWHPELMAIIQGSDILLKMLHIQKILGLADNNIINMTASQLVEFGRVHHNENIRKQFTENITEVFWSI
jgi:hypothetical protein